MTVLRVGLCRQFGFLLFREIFCQLSVNLREAWLGCQTWGPSSLSHSDFAWSCRTLLGLLLLLWFYFPSHYDTCSNITPTAPYISSAFNQMCPNCVLFLLHIRIFNKVFRYSLFGNIITKSTASYIKGPFLFSPFILRLTITASCPMDLQYFPMDSQLCYIEIESCKYYQEKHSQYIIVKKRTSSLLSQITKVWRDTCP